MIKEPVHLSDWIQYLISIKNLAFILFGVLISSIITLSGFVILYYNSFPLITYSIITVTIYFFVAIAFWLVLAKKSPLAKAQELFKEIMQNKNEIEVDKIRKKWFGRDKSMEKHKFDNEFKSLNELEKLGMVSLGTSVLLIVGGYIASNSIIFEIGKWTVSLSLAVIAIGFAYKTNDRMRELERNEIQRKLYMFKEENISNIKLIEELIKRKDNFFPPDLLVKKLTQEKEKKYNYTPQEWKRIAEGGLWIPKDEFSYDYALRVVEIAHQFNDSFIQEIKEYITKGRQLNARKDFCQQWIISRGNANPDETQNYYSSLDNAKDVCKKMEKLLENEIQNKESHNF